MENFSGRLSGQSWRQGRSIFPKFYYLVRYYKIEHITRVGQLEQGQGRRLSIEVRILSLPRLEFSSAEDFFPLNVQLIYLGDCIKLLISPRARWALHRFALVFPSSSDVPNLSPHHSFLLRPVIF